ncbi:bacteriocin immunity protein [Escherichia coli]|uniref:bacteriocin immunity protein n=1 Tax=Escherichia coli TaxID=562 RepID=UPI00097C0956|nr:bacteriocin immunity protein [Escherichia coli]EEU9490945.1 bacteriocin immunity protein [Escherichia coli]EEY8747533.1 bacteriocin immunity protein [Escherichia coli]EFE7498031.1 bacteriocin immunity protein [Escherichia coli]EFH6731829.1 bacteriocin immunity protein [Escherichia coli]EFI3013012.1 bacteriocin immunity protein [Escherichia coli]
MFKEKLQDYTEDEFLNFLGGLRSSMKDGKSLKGKELEMYWDSLVDHFIEITQHPSGSDLIFYPKSQGDDKPENILKIVKEWRHSQGLPLFKDSK